MFLHVQELHATDLQIKEHKYTIVKKNTKLVTCLCGHSFSQLMFSLMQLAVNNCLSLFPELDIRDFSISAQNVEMLSKCSMMY